MRPYSSEPQWSQNVGDEYVCTRKLWRVRVSCSQTHPVARVYTKYASDTDTGRKTVADGSYGILYAST